MLQLSSSRSVLQKCHQKDIYVQDRISGLPDEILVVILSLLTLKEAAFTSILSHRWRYLWTFSTGALNFDAKKALRKEKYATKYVGWVNHVLKLHEGNEIDQLRICFSLDARYSREVDSWVGFAIQKRVRKLELNFTNSSGFAQANGYNFPLPSSEILPLLTSNDVNYVDRGVRQPPTSAPFAPLVVLRLINVNVTEEVLRYVLANCHFLEELCVVGSEHLAKLNVAGPSLKLKHLVLYRCKQLKKLKISASNLVSFTYTGPKKKVPFKNPPLLSELCVGDEYCDGLIFKPQRHLSYFSQLEKLSLVIPYEAVIRSGSFPLEFPTLLNLKQLELRIALNCGFPLCCFTSLIKAAPSLSKFVLKLCYLTPLPPQITLLMENRSIRQREGTKHLHQCLKTVEFVGFSAHKTNIELALHLIGIAVSLEKITIDTRSPIDIWGPDFLCDAAGLEYEENSEAARECARQLEIEVPPGVEFVVI